MSLFWVLQIVNNTLSPHLQNQRMGLIDWSGKTDNGSGIEFSKFPFERGDMVTESAFGETPMLKLTDTQPLIITHEMIKRKLENIGYTDVNHSGPFGLKTAGTNTQVVDGWDQIGGYFKAQKYGLHISQDLIDGLKASTIFFFVFFWLDLAIFSDIFDEDLTIGLAILSFLIAFGSGIYWIILEMKRRGSMITAKLTYQGFRETAEKPHLGEELLESMLSSVNEHKLGPVSDFLKTVGSFSISHSNDLKLIACYSLDAKSKNAQKSLLSDIEYLDRMIPDSLSDSSTVYSAPINTPAKLKTEVQIHKKKQSFDYSKRFPIQSMHVNVTAQDKTLPHGLSQSNMEIPKTPVNEEIQPATWPPNPSQVKLYQTITSHGHNIGTLEEFAEKMKSEQSRWSFYSHAMEQNIPLGAWEDFEAKMKN
jgi:hypothetical protein